MHEDPPSPLGAGAAKIFLDIFYLVQMISLFP